MTIATVEAPTIIAPAKTRPTIDLPSKLYKWLQCAAATDAIAGWKKYILATDAGKLAATDGYRMHVLPITQEFAPGFYLWSSEDQNLQRVDDADAWSTPTYLAKNLFIPGLYHCADLPALSIVSCSQSKVVRGWEMPKTNKTGQNCLFRKGKIGAYEYAICLGVDALPWIFDADGAHLDMKSNYLAIDAAYMSQALAGYAVAKVMRWRDTTRNIIVGERDEAHAIIMPNYRDRYWTAYYGEFPGLKELEPISTLK